MGAKDPRVAVITGDIIDSRLYSASERKRLNAALGRSVDTATRTLSTKVLARLDFRVTAGDEFQFVLERPDTALATVFLIRSLLAAEPLKPIARFRAAIGVGDAKYRPSRAARLRPYEWDGPPFIMARQGLELIKGTRSPDRWTALVTGDKRSDDEFDVILGLIDHVQKDWTKAQWEAVGWTVRGLKRLETARRLRVAHQNVSKRLSAAGWLAISAALHYLDRRIGAHPFQGAKP